MNSKRYRISPFNNFVVDTELNSRNNKAPAEYPFILNVIHNNEVNMKEHPVYCFRTDVRMVGVWVDGAGWLARDDSTSCQSKSVKLNGNAKTDEASSMHLKRVSAHEFLASGPANFRNSCLDTINNTRYGCGTCRRRDEAGRASSKWKWKIQSAALSPWKKAKRPTRTIGSINLIECSWIMGETVKNNWAAKEDSKTARLSLFNLDPAAESERGV